MNQDHKSIEKIDITLHERQGIPIIELSGSFSGEVAYDVLDFVKENLFKNDKYSFILDMNNLKKFLSRGVAVIIELCSEIYQKKGKIVLVCGRGEFRTILEECNIESLAEIAPDLDTALEKIPGEQI